jgi:dienelactone hydrolase
LVFCALLCVFGARVRAADNCIGAAPAAHGVSTLRLTLAGVPALVRIPHRVTKVPILLWHGFGPPGSAEELMQALPLDDVPAVKIYLGLPLFGARAPGPGEDSLAQRQSEDYGSRLFEPVVLGAVAELPAVVGDLRHRGCLGPRDPIGLFGFSAGGTAALVALIQRNVAVRAAVVINAPTGLDASIVALEHATQKSYVWTPHTREIAERSDAIRHADRIAAGTPALLVLQGADDTVVDPRGARLLEQALRPLYHQVGRDQRLQILLPAKVAHDWTQPQALSEVRPSVAGWFNSNL